MAASYSSVHASRGGRASRRWCRGTGRGGCCARGRASRGGGCRRAVVRTRHTYGRVVGRDRSIDAGDG